MPRTDRQTDKSSCWSVTAYNDEIAILEDDTKFPDFVKTVYGGRETCPETGNLHFQGAVILHSQQRFSALKKWLPTAHWEVARQREALIKYAMKDDTAEGEKTVRDNANPYLDIEAKMMILAQEYCRFTASDVMPELEYKNRNPKDGEFWYLLTAKVLPLLGGKAINSFAYPELRTIWRETKDYWISQIPRPPLSITEAADTVE